MPSCKNDSTNIRNLKPNFIIKVNFIFFIFFDFNFYPLLNKLNFKDLGQEIEDFKLLLGG
jgi:hypothetical protein